MTNAKSLWHISSGKSVISEAPLGLMPGKIVLHSLYSLISPGTERTVALGQVPSSVFDQMRVPYMEGDFDFPVKYGYSLVAESADGEVYHLMHPHQDRVVVDPGSLTLLPHHFPGWKGTLISNMETALTAYWDADPVQSEAILIMGFGWIGSLIAGVLKINGCTNVSVAEPLPVRAQLAKQLGFRIVENGDQDGYDLAFHCSATSEGLQACIDQMNREGRIIEVSWYGNRVSTLTLGEKFHYNRLTIRSSQVSGIPGRMQAHWDIKKRKEAVIRLLDNPYWDQYEMPVIPFEQAPALFEKIRKNETGSLTYLLKY